MVGARPGVRCAGHNHVFDRLLAEHWIDRYFPDQRPGWAHGDLILDNIIVGRAGTFVLIDPA
jgi:aminoglycoside phosphotransferase (APT) family kinase protein